MQEYEDSSDFEGEDEEGGQEIILSQEIHTIPVKDTLEHSIGTRCICSPKVSVKYDSLLVTHNAFDSRELVEDMLTGLEVDATGEDTWVNIIVNI